MLRIVKKPEAAPLQQTLLRLGAALFALVAAALIMTAMGYNPFAIYGKMVEGSVMSAYRFRETLNKAIPLVVLSLGISIAFKMKFWNIGAEGQFYMGAMGAAWVAFNAQTLPAYLLLPLMMLASLLMGGIWSLIPGVLKSRYGASESLVTLMMNYIAIKWVSYLQYGPWKDPKASGFPKMPTFVKAAQLPKVLGVHVGWIVALALVVLIYILLRYSKLGYEIAVLGESETTARYAGMNVRRVMLTAVMLSGGLCGLAGMMQASAIERSVTDVMSGGLGFTAIITTWLARLSPPAVVGVSFFFAMLLQGGAYLQTSMQVPASLAEILQGIILFFVLGSEFFTQYRIVRTSKQEEAAA